MRCATFAAGAAVWLAAMGAAVAQQQQSLTPQQLIDVNRAQENAAIERQYESTRKSTQTGSAAKADPWGNMRSPTPANKPKDGR